MHTLETERLILRQPQVTDAPDLQRLVNHPTIARNTLSIPYPYPDGAAVEFITERVLPSWEKGTDFGFALIRKPDTFIGLCGIHPDRGPHQRAEIGYWIGEPYWGQGYATEAARAVIDFGFEVLELNRIYAHYFTYNPASRRVQEKAGMTFEGVLRGAIHKDGAFIDEGVCAILRDEWAARKNRTP